MTPKRRTLVVGTCLWVPLIAACGNLHRDPLLGAWTRADYPGAICEFFGNGEWSNACFLTDGYAYKWERIDENRYYIGASYYACDTETAFSKDESSVTMSMLCGSTQKQTMQLLRFK